MALKDQKDVLIAWINGETIQFKSYSGLWEDCNSFFETDRIYTNDSHEYRIKPKEIVTTTRIERDALNEGFHATYSTNVTSHNIRLTWSENGRTLLKAEVIR